MKVHQKNPEGNNPKLKVHSEIPPLYLSEMSYNFIGHNLAINGSSLIKHKSKNVVFGNTNYREYIV